MRDQLLSKAEEAVQLALRAGADDAVSGVSWDRSLEFQWRDERIEKVQESTSQSLRLAVYKDGRFSSHGTNDLEPTRLAEFVAEAVVMTQALEPDPFRQIPDPALYEGRSDKDLEQVDSAIRALSREDRLAWCRAMEVEARKHEAVISATSGVADSYGISARCSSNGFSGVQEGTNVAYGVEVSLREDELKRPEAWWWVGDVRLNTLPEPSAVGAEALKRGVDRLGQAKIPSVTTTMVVDRESGGRLLGQVLGALTAGAVQQKRSFLADAAGKAIAPSLLTIWDRPLVPGMGGSRLYDGEGIASKAMPVIEEGRVSNYFVDTYYGRKLGWAPTSGSASNLFVEGGSKDAAELCKEAGSGIYVTSWLGGNANPTTGDYSFGVRGFEIENGELGQPVSEMNVSGNFCDLLQKLVAVGADPLPWATFQIPTLVFENVQFSGT